MACTNTTKPSVMDRSTSIYGAPQGQAGRTFGSTTYDIQGIILHCTDMTISQYVQYVACLTQPVLNTSEETTHHYSIGSSGALNQHIDDGNISWTFGAYSAASYPAPPTPTRTINWPVLQGVNGSSVSPDVYVLNIVVAKSYNQGTTCLTSSGLPPDQHDKLLQLLAYLTETYNIAIDADHIQWHDNIATQACPSNECTCKDIACLISDLNSYCDDSDCNNITYSEVDCDSISHLLALPDSCANSSGCIVSIPFDACCLGSLPEAGDIDFFVGVAAQDSVDPCDDDAVLCLVKNEIKVTSPLTGAGTTDNPLALDLCAFGAFVPDGTVATVLGIDDAGCMVEQDLAAVIAGAETPLTVTDSDSIYFIASGTSNHTLTANVKISATTGNQISINSDGLFVDFTCADMASLFAADTLTSIYGVNDVGECAYEDTQVVINNAICNIDIDDGVGVPLYVLGRAVDLTCPEYFTPAQIVTAGSSVADTVSVRMNRTATNIISAEVILDPAIDNVAEITVNGLYVPRMTVVALDDCISATITDNQLSVGVNISAALDNIISCESDGLYVKDLSTINSDCIDLDFNETTRELTAEILFAGPQNNVMNAAECIAGEGFYVPRGADLLVSQPMVGTGTGPDPIDIDFSLLDNQDLCDIGGVVPETLSLARVVGLDDSDCLRQYTGEQFIEQFLEINNGDCITATLTGNSLNIEPVISPILGGIPNVLSCTPTGLYVPVGAGLVPTTSNCVDLSIVNGIITATIITDPDGDNQVTCNIDGLFVPRGAGLTGGATDCMSVFVTDGVVTATPIISSSILTVDNALTCEPGGLFVPFGAGLTGGANDCFTVGIDGTGIITVEAVISPLIDNTLTCDDTGLYVPSGLVTNVNSTDCIEVTVNNGVLSVEPIVDPDVNNLLTCGVDGLLVTLPVLDTDCIDVDMTNGILSIEPIIDPAASNLLTCGNDGLLVEFNANTIADTDCINLDVTNGILTATPILAPDQGALTNVLRCIPGQGLYVPVAAGLTTVDGNCVELNLVNGVLFADIILDPLADNSISCNANGLYSQTITVADTNSLNLTINNGVITGDVIIDPDPDNTIVITPNGLFAPGDYITDVTDHTCIRLEVTNGILQAIPVIDPDPDNQMTCTQDGFYVAPGGGVTAADTDCISVDITAAEITATPIISGPQGGINNLLQCTPDGLYVPVDFISSVAPTQCIDIQVVDGVLIINPIISPLADNRLVCQGDGLYVEPLTGADSNCIDIDVSNGVITVNPILSPTLGNALDCLGDGLYVPQGANLQGLDTNCANVDIVDGVISVTPVLSGNLDNVLTCEADGLYVPQDFIRAVSATSCLAPNVTAGVLTIDPVVDPAVDNRLVCNGTGLYVPQIAVVDSNCIDLEITGNTLTANPIISAVADNQFQCLGDGMFVAKGAGLEVVDSNCFDFSITAGVLTGTPIISQAVDNILTCETDGLYVPQDFITDILDDNCINLTVTNGVLTAAPVLSALADNTLSCEQDGLYVQELQTVDTDCLQLDVTNNTLTANVIIDPAIDNTIVCQGTGLYSPPITVVDTNCIDVDLTNNVLTVNPIVSATAGNQVSCAGDGLYVPLGAGLQVLDTNCIDLNIANGVLSAQPIISQTAGNILTCEADGLYVPEDFITAVANTNCITLTEVAGVLTANPVIDPAADNQLVCQGTGLYVPPITVTDTNCIDVDLTNNVLTINPIISTTADNQVDCIGDGLYVPQAAGLEVLDTNCIDLDVTGGVLSAQPIISAIANNILTCEGDGLYVPDDFITAVGNTNCITLTETAGVLTANPVISAVADNQIQCLGDGLYVPDTSITTLDTDCITLALDGNNVLSANPVIAPAQGGVVNSLACIPGQGLYVPEGAGIVVNDTTSINLTLVGGVITGEVVIDPAADNLIQNNGLGLYVPPMGVIDDQCIDFTIVNNVMTASLIIDPDVNNILTCGPNGIGANLVPTDTDCISIDITNNVLTAEPILSPDLITPNIATCEAGGLYVPETLFTRDIGSSVGGANEINIDTDGDGIIDFTFCEGICEIVSENTCVDGGVGAGYYVNEAQLVGNTLRLNSLPVKPMGASGTASQVDVNSGAIGVTTENASTDLVVGSDPCYDILIKLVYSANVIGEIPANTDISFFAQFAVDGVNQPATASYARFITGAAAQEFAQEITTVITFLLPAGAAAVTYSGVLTSVLNAGGPVLGPPVYSLNRLYYTYVS